MGRYRPRIDPADTRFPCRKCGAATHVAVACDTLRRARANDDAAAIYESLLAPLAPERPQGIPSGCRYCGASHGPAEECGLPPGE